MFRFVTPVRNANFVFPAGSGAFIAQCIRSTKAQDDPEFRHYIIDDCSDDGTWDVIQKEVGGDERYVIRRNDSRLGTLPNHLTLMRDFEWDPEDVVLHLDGDDRLADEQSLSHIKRVYEDTGCWVSYGNYSVCPKEWDRNICNAPLAEGHDFRGTEWVTSHLRTFKKFLFDVIPDDNFLDAAGKVYTSAPDVSLFTPVLELAGVDRIAFVDRVVYTYQLHNGNEHFTRTGLSDQARCAIHYKRKTPFPRLDSKP